MNKLHSFVLCALVTPALALSSGVALAEKAADQEYDQQQQQSTQGDQQTGTQSPLENQRYMDAAPTDGMQASNLIGAEVTTTGDEEVGNVSDLIIDRDGKVVAVVVSVGGFLGMGEKDVAIGWDEVSRSGTSDERELRIDMTRDDLNSAPEFERQE